MNRLFYLLTGDARVLDLEEYSRLGVETIFPLWITLFLAVGAALFAWHLYRRERSPEFTPGQRRLLTCLRAAAYISLLFVLVQPRLTIEGKGRPAGPLPVVLDRTESMSIEDLKGKPRLQAALGVTAHLREAKGQGLRQAPYLYGDKVEPWSPTPDRARQPGPAPAGGAAPPAPAAPDAPPSPERNIFKYKDLAVVIQGGQTSLNDMLRGGLREHLGGACPGILLVTDGANNVNDDLSETVQELARKRIPVYVIATGKASLKDIALTHLAADEIIFKDEKAKFFVTMEQRGYTGRPLPVKGFFGSEKLPLSPVTPERDGETIFPIEVTPTREGLFDLVVEVPPDSEEVTDRNNKITRKIRVIKDRIRVLLAFGAPSWEFRFLTGAFARDRRVAHQSYLQSIDPRLIKHESEQFIAALPERAETLFRRYDLVILSKLRADALPRAFQELLRDFVSNEGGGLVIIADGADLPFSLKNTPLEGLLPLTIEAPVGPSSFQQEMFKSLRVPYTFELAEDGLGNPLTSFHPDRAKNQQVWRSFPPLYEAVTDGRLKPSAIPLVNCTTGRDAPRYPAIVYHNYGKGTVLYMTFDSSWRWRKEFGDRYFRDYWGRVVQFLGLPHLLGETAAARIFTDGLMAPLGSRVVVTAVIRNKDYTPFVAPSVTARVQLKEGQDRDLVLTGLPSRPGIFRATFSPEVEGKVIFRLPVRFAAEPAELQVMKVNREFQDSGFSENAVQDLAKQTKGDLFLAEAPSVTLFADQQAVPAEGRSRSQVAHLETERLARQERREQLVRALTKLGEQKKTAYDDDAYLKQFAEHVLKTISERRLPITVSVEPTLWDAAGLFLLTILLLCTEYYFRKRWYLD